MTEQKPTWDEVAEDIFIEHHAAWQRLAQLDTAVELPDPRDERIRVLEEALRPFAAIYHISLRQKTALSVDWFKAAADALAVGPPVMMVYVTEE